VPPPPPVVDPAPPTGGFVPSSYDLPPGAPPVPPVSSSVGSDAPLQGSGLGGADLPSITPAVPSTKEERLWATLIHLSGIVGASLAAFFIPGNILLPLVLWLIKREGNSFVNDQGKEALNFQITITIASIVSALLVFLCIGVPMLIVVGVISLVLSIIAAIKANEGVAYRYPFTLRLIS